METQNLLDGFTDDNEMASSFNVCKRTIQRWRRQGKLPPKTDPGDLTSIKAVRERLEAKTSEGG